MRFDTIAVVDWSARAAPSPARPAPDAIWIAVQRDGAPDCTYHRTRSDAMAFINTLIERELAANRRVLLGFDFPFGYPQGFARRVCGSDDPLALWGALHARLRDGDDNANNRFDVAEALNRLFDGVGPFWGCPAPRASADLPARAAQRHGHGMAERRRVECEAVPRAQPVWKLFTTGSVGSQALLGIARLEAMRRRYGDRVAVRPFESRSAPVVLAEVYPSLLSGQIAALREADEIPDRAQVRVTAMALRALAPARLGAMLAEGDPEEGWITGAGHAAELAAALAGAQAEAPRLRNDCFALPPGVHWTPVEDALAQLRAGLVPVAEVETRPLTAALGRILGAPQVARRSHPAHPNAAVDGYGFAGPAAEGPQRLPLVPGRSAAGAPFDHAVPKGQALRVLTGAALPAGVDTVVLQEDVQQSAEAITFHGPLRRGANARAEGEDLRQGDTLLSAGRILTPADLALLAAAGIGTLALRRPLRVGVLSTGDEVIEPGAFARAGQIHDANRPMLLALLTRWGMEAVDLGIAADDRAALHERLSSGARQVDAVLTSGGASAGDEDHLSALLNEAGAMQTWRIAVKPGRPLALGLWEGKPIFGLPGNPVAAMVCALIFARPALYRLAGADWSEPVGVDLPAAFEKRKKAGRREYLRARVRAGAVEVFASEGSGRVSGLSWAEGLVELAAPARHVRPGDPVRFISYASFGL